MLLVPIGFGGRYCQLALARIVWSHKNPLFVTPPPPLPPPSEEPLVSGNARGLRFPGFGVDCTGLPSSTSPC